MPDTAWHYAVVVGIDQYPAIDNGRYDLSCPLLDAQRMEDWLTSKQGGNIDPARVKVLTRSIPKGRNPPVPVFDEINKAILECAEDFVDRRKQQLSSEAARKAAWQTSRLYLYISGHGMDGDGDDAVLITANATRSSMNHISTRNVVNRLKTGKVFAELIVLADCCRDLSGVNVQDLPWDLRNYMGYNDPILPRTFIAYASRNRKKAFEVPSGAAIQNSIFTQALLEGLGGGVSGTCVESRNLERFLYNYVPKLAEQYKLPDQNPEIRADPDIVFWQNSKSYQLELTAKAGSAFDGLPSVDVVEMEKGVVHSRVTLNATAPNVFKGTLPTGFYAAVPTGGDPMTGAPVSAFSVLGKDTNERIG